MWGSDAETPPIGNVPVFSIKNVVSICVNCQQLQTQGNSSSLEMQGLVPVIANSHYTPFCVTRRPIDKTSPANLHIGGASVACSGITINLSV